MNCPPYSIIVAENCGFCFGVRRAVEIVYELRKKTDKRIYVIGELIHNDVFIERLKNDGIFCIEKEHIDSLLPERDNIIVVIRTHGVTKQLSERLVADGFEVVDATCPFVKRIHKIVDENSSDGSTTLIVGDKNHPEVVGIQSYAHAKTEICSDDEECSDFVNNEGRNLSNKLLLVSQTTGNNEKYVNCQKVIKKVYTNAKIFDTICNVTENRQNEAKRLAGQADVMCVIGGTKSSNTRKLYDIASEYCRNVYLLEKSSDVPEEDFRLLYTSFADQTPSGDDRRNTFTIGITAGASTPDDIIEEVKVRIENILGNFHSDEKQNNGNIHN